MTEQFLRESRSRIFSGADRDLYLHAGYFMTWFNQIESQLTFLLAKVLGMRDLEQFELLIGGMDARVKCERLKKA